MERREIEKFRRRPLPSPPRRQAATTTTTVRQLERPQIIACSATMQFLNQ